MILIYTPQNTPKNKGKLTLDNTCPTCHTSYIIIEREENMRELNINLRPSENLYMTTYEDGTVEYIPATPKDHKKEVKRLRNLGVVFATEKRNDLVK